MAEIDHSKSFELPKFDHRILDLTGKQIGRLTVISFAGRNKRNLIIWNCLCDCGNTTLATSNDLTAKILRNRKRSCGCLGGDVTRERSITHGRHNSPTYKSWKAMKDRCLRSSATGYDRYGGRGITICQRWIDSFEAFLADVGERPGMEYSIDRIDNSGNYEPDNCRWATRKEQSNNRRKKIPLLFLEFNGKRQSVEQWAIEIGIKVGTIYCRRCKGLPIDKVLSRNTRFG